mmetsp:Transcript_4842/g.6656  ORF Transcript_4842/g.6656 Transcript_4842/m.6656 type:complete len:325 (+) Transcript_4842:44-1018(+)
MYDFSKGEETEIISFCSEHEDAKACLHPLSLSVERCSANAPVLNAIRSTLRRCINISDLSISRMNISGDARVRPLLNVLSYRFQSSSSSGQGKGLTYLQLVECRLTDNDARLLVNSVTCKDSEGFYSSPLVMLNLQGNRIGNRGAEAISLLLERGSSLTELDLSANRIGDEGAVALGDALTRNSSLKIINLSENRINQEGAKAFATALKKDANHTLEALFLGGNRIGSSGTKSLCKALIDNFTLKTLDISSNGIGDVGAACVTNLVQQNVTLDEINLEGNGIGICYCKGCVLKRVKKEHYIFGMRKSEEVEMSQIDSNEENNHY